MRVRPAATQEERSSTARRRLIDAGIRLIGQQGYEATSLASVGEAAGYSRGLVSHHFGSKEAFAAAVFEDLRTRFVEEMQAAIRGLSGAPALDRYIESYLAVGRRSPDDTRCFFILTTVAATSAPDLVRSVLAHSLQVRVEIERLLGRVLRDVPDADDLDLAGMAIVIDGLLRGVTQELVLDPGLDVDRSAKAVAMFSRRALGLT